MDDVQSDLSRVERKLDKLIHSLVGDELVEGAMSSVNKRITEAESDLSNLSRLMGKMALNSLTPEEHKGIKDLLTFLTGWKLTLGIFVWLAPLITFIVERILK